MYIREVIAINCGIVLPVQRERLAVQYEHNHSEFFQEYDRILHLINIQI